MSSFTSVIDSYDDRRQVVLVEWKVLSGISKLWSVKKRNIFNWLYCREEYCLIPGHHAKEKEVLALGIIPPCFCKWWLCSCSCNGVAICQACWPRSPPLLFQLGEERWPATERCLPSGRRQSPCIVNGLPAFHSRSGQESRLCWFGLLKKWPLLDTVVICVRTACNPAHVVSLWHCAQGKESLGFKPLWLLHQTSWSHALPSVIGSNNSAFYAK